VADCGGDLPAGLEPLEPSFATAGDSRCHAVSGEITQSGLIPDLAGTISGDVVGTVTTRIDLSDARAAARVRFGTAEQTWEVTGGVVSELIGRTVRLSLENRIVDTHPPLGRNNTRATVVAGARKGNLTYHGPVTETEATVEYHGVICP
jgi:hypothetical protein